MTGLLFSFFCSYKGFRPDELTNLEEKGNDEKILTVKRLTALEKAWN